MTQRPMKSSIIPETVWAVAEEHIIQQYTMCVLCGPSTVPEKVFYIRGTSLCSQHAHEYYTKIGIFD